MLKLTLLLGIDIESEKQAGITFFRRNYSRQIFPASITEGGSMGTCWEEMALVISLVYSLGPAPSNALSPTTCPHWVNVPHFCLWQLPFANQSHCCVLWAHPDGCWIQPSSQTTREVLGDEAGPRLTQEGSLQAGSRESVVRNRRG